MAILYQGFEVFVEPIGLVIAIVFLYGVVGRSAGPAWVRYTVLGTSFGLAAVFSMFNPITVADGIIVDMRNIFVGLSVAFFGPIAGFITIAISALARISIGGAGTAIGLGAMVLASAGGLAWRYFFEAKKISPYRQPLVLSLLISAHLLAVFLLPSHIMRHLLTTIVPIVLIANIIGTYILFALISRERGLIEETETLFEAASTDPLTNLLNRRSTELAVANLPLERVPGNGRAILYYDVDNFKKMNDTNGHAVGDAILKGITTHIKECLRPQDLFARLGGDEFAIILPDVNRSDAHTIAERCRNVVESMELEFDGAFYSVTISVGVRWSTNPPNFARQLAQADSALYAAKVSGRNQVAFETSVDAYPEDVTS